MGISRKAFLTAEKGKVQFETLITIMKALQLTEQLKNPFRFKTSLQLNWLSYKGANDNELPNKKHQMCRSHLNGKAVVNVHYDDRVIGAVNFDTEWSIGLFDYRPGFIKSGIEFSPIRVPLSRQIYSFPRAEYETFIRLLGLVADSLPDDFANVVSLAQNWWLDCRKRRVAKWDYATPTIAIYPATQNGHVGILSEKPINRVGCRWINWNFIPSIER